jgi:predicted DsbA family dithiol-disulfide isomerase
MTDKIKLSCFSDTLCFWAYAAQIRLDELKQNFADRVEIEHHFISVFGNTAQRIGTGWKDRRGYEGFSDHTVKEAKTFSHLHINHDIWRKTRPKTSATSHLFLKAVQLQSPSKQLLHDKGVTMFDALLWDVRCAFFEQALDIGRFDVLWDIAGSYDLPREAIEKSLEDGSALAALMSDMDMKEQHKLEGSPTYILNDGRQKLYGNVGYRVIEANVSELLEKGQHQLSWC